MSSSDGSDPKRKCVEVRLVNKWMKAQPRWLAKELATNPRWRQVEKVESHTEFARMFANALLPPLPFFYFLKTKVG